MSSEIRGAELAVASVVGIGVAGVFAAVEHARLNRDANRLHGWVRFYAARSANADAEIARLRQQLAAKDAEIAEAEELAIDYKSAYDRLSRKLGKPRLAA